MRLEGLTWLALKLSTSICIPLKPSRSGFGSESLLRKVKLMQSPALARNTSGSIGAPALSVPLGFRSSVGTTMIAVGSLSGPGGLAAPREVRGL
jgi:hypothetical protein